MKLNILLICDYHPNIASTITDHIFAFKQYSQHRIFILNSRGDLPAWVSLSSFDVIVLHYSIIISHENYLSEKARTQIRDFSGYKVVYIQDDYRWINRTAAALEYMKINTLFGLTDREVADAFYGEALQKSLRKETVLAGYVSKSLLKASIIPWEKRMYDVGYRARKVPAWIGAHAQQKYEIAKKFLEDIKDYPDIKHNISCEEIDRIYGKKWLQFLANCRAVLGTESGSSCCDFTGELQQQVEAFERQFPNASFEEIRDLYFKELDGKYMINVISPRVFEAAALRCLMILYEGEYSGILKPGRHYVPLKKDHSNLAEVIAILRNPTECQKITEQAYREVILNENYHFSAMVKHFDEVIAEDYRVTVTPSSSRLKVFPFFEGSSFRMKEFIFLIKIGWTKVNLFLKKLKFMGYSKIRYFLNRVHTYSIHCGILVIKKVIPQKYQPIVHAYLKNIYRRLVGSP